MIRAGTSVVVEGVVAVVTMEGNGYDLENIVSLCGWVDELGQNDAIQAIVVQGVADAFWIGASAQLLEHMCESTRDTRMEIIRSGQRNIVSLLRSPKLIVAHVDGFAAGGGVDLMLACDLALATPSARINLFYTKLGVLPDHGSLFLLADRIGWHAALRAAEGSVSWTAEQCVALGLVEQVLRQRPALADWPHALRKHLRLPSSTRAALKAARWAAMGHGFEAHLEQVADGMATLLGNQEQLVLIRRMRAMQDLKAAAS